MSPPEPVNGLQQGLLAGFHVQIGHTGRQVGLAHRMSGDFLGFSHRHVVLVILRAVCAQPAHFPLPTLINKELRQSQIGFVSWSTIELNQRHLNFRMPARPFPFSGAEYRGDMVGQAAGNLQQSAVAKRPLEGHRGLKQVAGAVQFVAKIEIGPFAVRCNHLEVAVQVSVWFLGGNDQGNHLVGHSPEFGVCGLAHLPGQCLKPLVHVLVQEVHARVTSGLGAGRHLRL